MTFDKETIAPIIELMGYRKGVSGDVWKKSGKDCIYGVDFANGEVFKFANGERVLEDPEDKILNDTIQAVKSEVSVLRSGNAKSQTHDNVQPPTCKEVPAQPKNEPTNNKSCGLLDLINSYVGNDVLEIFGDTGSGKSKFALKVAQDAIAAGKKVFYLDTERNLTDADIASLKNCEYRYTPILDEVDRIVQKLPDADVVIVDSIGFPVLTSFARLSVKQKGDALLKLIAIFGDLKAWAYKNNGIAVVTNQPESEFNKSQDHILRPFGDKSQFAAKEIWKTTISERTSSKTKINIMAFRSRSVGHKTRIANMEVTSSGVTVEGVN